MIAGDFCPTYRISSLIEQGKFEFFNFVKEIAQKADFSMLNLECPIIEVGKSNQLLKYRPSLSSSKKALDVLKYAYIDHVTLANNHLRDHGDYGVLNTIKELDNLKITHVGGGQNLNAANKVFYKDIKGEKLAIVNFCEHEFSIASSDIAGAAPLNPVNNYYQIQEARQQADYVIVVVHGGHEHYEYPSRRMKYLYRWFVDIGADAVINHHQHCVNGYELYDGKPIFYGIGNLCFDNEDKRDSLWNKGIVVMLNMGSTINFEIYPYEQCNQHPAVLEMKSDKKDFFLSHLDYISRVIQDDEELERLHSGYRKSRYREMSIPFTPYSNRFLISAYIRKLLPSFITKKRIMPLLNYFDCESHRDVMQSYLYSNLFNK